LILLLIPVVYNGFIGWSRFNNKVPWKLIKVIDGNSFVAQKGKKQLQIKLCGISANDKESITYLQHLLSKGDLVVNTVKKEKKQIVAEIFIRESQKEIHVNSQMLINGMATIDNNYKICPNGENLIRAKK